MKKTLFLIAFFSVALLIYEFIPFGDKETETVANKKPVSQLAGDQKNLVAKSHNKTKINKSQKFSLKTDLEQIWFENDQSIPVLSYMDELFAEVDNGNPIAKFQLSFIHQICFNAPENEQQLNEKLARIKAENSQQHLVNRYVFCEGYPRDKISMNDIGRLIKEAARAGHPIAKREFIKYAFEGITKENIIENAEMIVDLKRESFQHLIDARNMGDEGSLLSLGMAYEDGQVIEQDYVEAYVHYHAFNILNPGSSDALLSMLEENLTQEEIDYAIERGEQYAQCCN